MQAAFTPAGSHVESAAHVVHISLPDAEKVLPPIHGAASPLHTVSEPVTQAVLAPCLHVEVAVHERQGSLPEALHVEPAAQGT